MDVGKLASPLLAVLFPVPASAFGALSSQRERVLLTSRPAPPGQECEINLKSSQLPAFDAVADSSIVSRAIAELWAREGYEPGFTVLSLSRDSTGLRRPPTVVDGTLDGLASAELADIVSRNVRPLANDSLAQLRVRLKVGDTTTFRVGASELCGPALTNREHLLRLLSANARSLGGPKRAVVWVFVGTKGQVADAKIQESSGDAEFDRIALGVTQRAEFKPARIDYLPLAVWAALPLSIRKP